MPRVPPIILIELEGNIVDSTQGLLVGVDGDYLKDRYL